MREEALLLGPNQSNVGVFTPANNKAMCRQISPLFA